jgi:ubiquinone/menaquinone biosynthesis C-methylase UbiE
MPGDLERSGTWDGVRYSRQTTHHRAFDEWFLERHPPVPTDHVIDVGCGTGEFTAQLAEIASEGAVIGVDPDDSMLSSAAQHVRPNLEFRHGPAQQLDLICDPESADRVVSRATFHWIPFADYPRCYEAIRRVLRPGGWFHAESGGGGNVERVVRLMDDIASAHGLGAARATLPHPAAVFELLEQAGFAIPSEGVHTVAQRRAFDRHQLLGFIRTQAALAYVVHASDEVREVFVREVETRVNELRREDGSYDQTFVRLEALARRPT